MSSNPSNETPRLILVCSAPTVNAAGDVVVDRQALIDERAWLLARIDWVEKRLNKIPRTSELRCMDDLARRKGKRDANR